MKLKKIQTFNDDRVTSFEFINDYGIIGTATGSSFFFEYHKDFSVKQFAKMKNHQLPIRSLILNIKVNKEA